MSTKAQDSSDYSNTQSKSKIQNDIMSRFRGKVLLAEFRSARRNRDIGQIPFALKVLGAPTEQWVQIGISAADIGCESPRTNGYYLDTKRDLGRISLLWISAGYLAYGPPRTDGY